MSVAPYRKFHEGSPAHHSALASELSGQVLGCDCVAAALNKLLILSAIDLLTQEHAQVLDDRMPRFELRALLQNGLPLLSNVKAVFQLFLWKVSRFQL